MPCFVQHELQKKTFLFTLGNTQSNKTSARLENEQKHKQPTKHVERSAAHEPTGPPEHTQVRTPPSLLRPHNSALPTTLCYIDTGLNNRGLSTQKLKRVIAQNSTVLFNGSG